jgi:hypothetical protein
MAKVKAYTKGDGTLVSGYERGKPDPEDGTGIELPHVAPKTEVEAKGRPKIIDVPRAGTPRLPAPGSGVTIMGGSSHGQRKAPEIKHGKRSR